ncbi:galactokinase [Actinosynnema sp. NPDC047251]|uniref:Galactokinase n=1 Tax=Saccharothrix espanaensis (strain ATCC 51144 / DSM 44229 / JCM 9112 / NBRC 15066 / NRRL 15764) TaxID=1179773 RepID=K0JXY9_SACES|nr:galactokinase [Saccharothrix espanaensis]CCH29058.1 Galactokinase [Saccharothrix espanaensis DSM 44229]
MTQGQRAALAFGELHGTAPQGVWSAPGRVNLIGEHTDYNDGFVLPFALPHRTAVAASPRGDGKLAVSTLGDDGVLRHAAPVAVADLEPGRVTGWAAYPAGVAWALRDLGVTGGADLVIAGDVPAGAGLSSSHALECAVALALLGLAGVPEDRPEIARRVQRAENDFVGAPTGLLDQTASLLCTEAHVLFLDVRSGEAEQVPFDAAASGLEVLVVDTRAHHSNTDGGYASRRAGCERAAALLGVPALRDVEFDRLDQALARLPEDLRPLVRHVVTEDERVLRAVDALRAGALADLGPLLTASHESLRDDYRVSVPELDVAVGSALAEGALGARMVGGGFGGSAIALVPVERHDAVVRRVLAAYAERDWATPRTFPAVPSAGAGREH